MTKREIESFLLNKRGYIKKSPIETAKALWKTTTKRSLPKNEIDLEKDLKLISSIQSTLRKTKVYTTDVETPENEGDRLIEIYNKIVEQRNKPKRKLFFDIETSPNIVFSWSIGRKINIDYDNIIDERAIICICWKFEDEDKVHHLTWNNGDDREMLEKFTKVVDSADIVIGQNSDAFDIKWLRARCVYHGIEISPKFNSIDTMKLAKSGFRFNSNRLDYMGQYLGEGKKIKTEYNLWKEVVLNKDKEALAKMVDYCKQDVKLLERVYNRLKNYVPKKKFELV